jgi:hypothetical protein
MSKILTSPLKNKMGLKTRWIGGNIYKVTKGEGRRHYAIPP